MADYMTFFILCCLWACSQPGLAVDYDDDSAVALDGELNADYILELANLSHSSLLKLIGTIYKNFEKNMSKATEQTRVEILMKQTCEFNECGDWTEWSECPAPKGDFAMHSRFRECGRNNSQCTYPESKDRTEEESRLCIGKNVVKKPTTAADGSTTAKTTTTSSSATNDSSITCPEHYDQIFGYCLQLVLPFTYPYNLAQTLCAWDGGSLVNVNTARKQNALYLLLKNHNFDDPVWLDGIKPDAASSFQYTNGAPPNVNNWAPGMPVDHVDDAVAGRVEKLCRLDMGRKQKKWTAKPCDTHKASFVCEYSFG